MSREIAEARLDGVSEAAGMVVGTASDTGPSLAGSAAAFSPSQTSSSANTEAADVVIEEDSTQAVSRVKGLLSCSACGVLLQYGEHTPKLLPSCLHTVCSRCAQQRNSEEGFQCGLCMTTSPTVLDHPLVEELLQREHVQQRNQFCGQCGERGKQALAAGVCEQCSTELCHVCIGAHRITKATWEHNIRMFDVVFAEPQCPKHNKVYDNYCDTCREMGCGDCILSSHRAHQSCTLESKDAEIKLKLQTSLESMRTLRASLGKKMDTLKKSLTEAEQSKQTGIDSIQGHYQDYQERIRAFFSKQLEVANERYDAYGNELRTLLHRVSLMELRLAHLDNFAHRLLENGRPATLIGNAKLVLTLAKKLGMVDMVWQPERRLPKVELRRHLPIDRIGDMISLTLYDGESCMQQQLQNTYTKSFLVITAQIIGVQLRSSTDFGLKYVTMLFQQLIQLPSMRPEMYQLIKELHEAVMQIQVAPAPVGARATLQSSDGASAQQEVQAVPPQEVQVAPAQAPPQSQPQPRPAVSGQGIAAAPVQTPVTVAVGAARGRRLSAQAQARRAARPASSEAGQEPAPFSLSVQEQELVQERLGSREDQGMPVLREMLGTPAGSQQRLQRQTQSQQQQPQWNRQQLQRQQQQQRHEPPRQQQQQRQQNRLSGEQQISAGTQYPQQQTGVRNQQQPHQPQSQAQQQQQQQRQAQVQQQQPQPQVQQQQQQLSMTPVLSNRPQESIGQRHLHQQQHSLQQQQLPLQQQYYQHPQQQPQQAQQAQFMQQQQQQQQQYYSYQQQQQHQAQQWQLQGQHQQQQQPQQLQMPWQHQQRVSTHQPQVSAHQQQVPTYQQQVPTHQQQVSAHQQQVPTHQQQVPIHQQQVPTHQQQVPTHQQQVSGHQQQVSPHQQQVSPHQQQVPAQQQFPTQQQQQVSTQQQLVPAHHQQVQAQQQQMQTPTSAPVLPHRTTDQSVQSLGASDPLRALWSQTQNLVPSGVTATASGLVAEAPPQQQPSAPEPEPEPERQEIPINWHNPATPKPMRPMQLSLVDKPFRVPLGRKRMPSGDDSPVTQAGDATTTAEHSSSSPTAETPQSKAKRARNASVAKPDVTMTRILTLLDGSSASSSSPTANSTSAAASMTAVSYSSVAPSVGTGVITASATAAANGTVRSPAETHLLQTTEHRTATVARNAAASLGGRSGLTLTPLSPKSSESQSWAKLPTPKRPTKQETPSPLKNARTPESQPPMVALFDQQDAQASGGQNPSGEGRTDILRPQEAGDAGRTVSSEEHSGAARASAGRKRGRGGRRARGGARNLRAGARGVGRGGASSEVQEKRQRPPPGAGSATRRPGRPSRGQPRSRPTRGRSSPPEVPTASPGPDSSRDAFILQNCAPRDPSERHSSGEDRGAEDALMVDMQVEEPAEQLHLAASAVTSLPAPTPTEPQAAAGREPAAGLDGTPGVSVPAPDGAGTGAAAQSPPPPPPTGEAAGGRGSPVAGPSRHRSSDSSASRRRSSEQPLELDPLVPLDAQSSVSARCDELTHVVRVPESVASGEAALSWEPARDPLGICFPSDMLYQPPERGPKSPNISYCVLCWDGGDLLLCDSCEKAFHRECYVGPVGDEGENSDSTWHCLMCSVMPLPLSPSKRQPGSSMNEQDMTLARRLLTDLYATYYPAMYFKNLENMSLKRSSNSYSRAWQKRILVGAKPKLSEGFSRQSAFHFSLYSICQPFKEKKLPEFEKIERPLCLDDIKERLLNREFSSLMSFLRKMKKMVDQIRFFKKGTPVQKYLKELDEKFEEFLQRHMKDYWLQLDDGASSR